MQEMFAGEHVCKYCEKIFSSRNRLFKHFQEGGACTEAAIEDGMPAPETHCPPRKVFAREPQPAPESHVADGAAKPSSVPSSFCHYHGWGDGSQFLPPREAMDACASEGILEKLSAAQTTNEIMSPSNPCDTVHDILVLGECDFSFSIALQRKLAADSNLRDAPQSSRTIMTNSRVVATTLATSMEDGPGRKVRAHKRIAKHIRKLIRSGAYVKFGIDATRIAETLRRDNCCYPQDEAACDTIPERSSFTQSLSDTADRTVFSGTVPAFGIIKTSVSDRPTGLLSTVPLSDKFTGRRERSPDLADYSQCGNEETRYFSRIFFCFPYASATDQKANESLLSGFFASAARLLRKDGRIVLLLNICFDENCNVAVDQWEEWNLENIAAQHGLKRVAARAFDPQEFPEYQPRRANGEAFVPGLRRGGTIKNVDITSRIGMDTDSGMQKNQCLPRASWHFLKSVFHGDSEERDVTKIESAAGRPGKQSSMASTSFDNSAKTRDEITPELCSGTENLLEATRCAQSTTNVQRLQRHGAAKKGQEFPVPLAVRTGLQEFEILCDLNENRRLYTPECVFCVDDFFSGSEADTLFAELLDSLSWDGPKERKINRMMAVFCDLEDVMHRISNCEGGGQGHTLMPPLRSPADLSQGSDKDKEQGIMPSLRSWREHPLLVTIKKRIEAFYFARTRVSLDFSVCVANLYRDGHDSISWHSDFEEYGKKTPIASVSLGAERQFLLRSVQDREDRVWKTLRHGSLLIMENLCQHRYVHCVPRDPNVPSPRLNLTFRVTEQEYLAQREQSYF